MHLNLCLWWADSARSLLGQVHFDILISPKVVNACVCWVDEGYSNRSGWRLTNLNWLSKYIVRFHIREPLTIFCVMKITQAMLSILYCFEENTIGTWLCDEDWPYTRICKDWQNFDQGQSILDSCSDSFRTLARYCTIGTRIEWRTNASQFRILLEKTNVA